MKPLQFTDHPDVRLEPTAGFAIARTIESWMSPLRHLPVPVRFRASGALRAWQGVFDKLPGMTGARAALADPGMSLHEARDELSRALDPYIKVRTGAETMFTPMFSSMLAVASAMLAFWLRGGVLYEPTQPLGALLGGTDIARDLPLQLIAPKSAALCIIPPWQQRHHCADRSAVLVFEHRAADIQAPAVRALAIFAYRPTRDSLLADELSLPVKDENGSLSDALERASASTRDSVAESTAGDGRDADDAVEEWRLMLDYVVKVLLYLDIDNAAVRARCPFSAAPKEFPGFGRKKREAKLAEVEQLYDRYIVGPETFSAAGLTEPGERPLKGHDVSAHWRRGHFRSQPHGPQASLRKVIFLAPTIVRADKIIH